MDSKKFKSTVIIRILLIITTSILLYETLGGDNIFLTPILFLFLLVIQLISLIKFLDKKNSEIASFLDSIEFDDDTASFTTSEDAEPLNKINQEFNKIILKFKSVRREKEADYQYMKNIVQHVGIGLITFEKDSGQIQIMNAAAKKVLRVSNLVNIRELKSLNENLVDIILRLKTGGRDLIKLEVGGDLIQLAVYAIELNLRGKEYKLVSLQNIHSELEEKEMEAWQNLVRVLTHEIMNSITPIQSLAATVESEIESQIKTSKLNGEQFEDMQLAVQTIQKRSQGLIRFIQDFRNLTHTPKPKLKTIKVTQMLDEIGTLMQKELDQNKIYFIKSLQPADLKINADKELIEQVLINLIKNSIQAFDEQNERIIEMRAYKTDKGRPVISVKDNGSGIDEEALQRIFIPFYTTKKSGSGIGLSLSRQIMRQHQGSITVKSKLDEGTEFSLKF
ncbi:MAG TPA: ATP-binding protein [Cyclobacteriaceae bacterium]|jgi:nitrogen fixation/metabolism regulation signal transduction histidine kinase